MPISEITKKTGSRLAFTSAAVVSLAAGVYGSRGNGSESYFSNLESSTLPKGVAIDATAANIQSNGLTDVVRDKVYFSLGGKPFKSAMHDGNSLFSSPTTISMSSASSTTLLATETQTYTGISANLYESTDYFKHFKKIQLSPDNNLSIINYIRFLPNAPTYAVIHGRRSTDGASVVGVVDTKHFTYNTLSNSFMKEPMYGVLEDKKNSASIDIIGGDSYTNQIEHTQVNINKYTNSKPTSLYPVNLEMGTLAQDRNGNKIVGVINNNGNKSFLIYDLKNKTSRMLSSGFLQAALSNSDFLTKLKDLFLQSSQPPVDFDLSYLTTYSDNNNTYIVAAGYYGDAKIRSFISYWNINDDPNENPRSLQINEIQNMDGGNIREVAIIEKKGKLNLLFTSLRKGFGAIINGKQVALNNGLPTSNDQWSQ